MNEPHVAPQDADLYALGALDDAERARCDAHAATCDACAKMLGDSASVIEALEVRGGIMAAPPSLQFVQRRSSAWMFAAGLCASLAVAALLFVRVLFLGASMHNGDVAMLALVHSHFNHAPFVAQHARAPVAKVMYARDGRWLFVVVDHATASLSIEGVDASGQAVELGHIPASAGPATDFVQPEHRIVRVNLDDESGSVLASARLGYP